MITLLKLLALVAFALVGGFLVYTAGAMLDHQLQPDCNLCRLAAVSLFETFVIGFGVLAVVYPPTGQGDSFHWH